MIEGTAPAAVNRKSRTGTVVSDVNEKTIIVEIVRQAPHRIYRKVIRRTKRYHVHDSENRATVGDIVRIEECRPISKTKRWQLVEVLTERQVADVAPEELDEGLVEEIEHTTARAEPGAGAEAETGSEPVVVAETQPEVAPDGTSDAAQGDEDKAE